VPDPTEHSDSERPSAMTTNEVRQPVRPETSWWKQAIVASLGFGVVSGLISGIALFVISSGAEDSRSNKAERLENLRHVRTSAVKKFALIDLQGMPVRSLDLREAVFTEANFSGGDLSYSDLRAAEMLRADVTAVTMSYTNLSHAKLFGAHLKGASIKQSNLVHADLTNADLSGADLTQSNFTLALLYRANLSGVRHTGAIDFTGAFLDGADLRGIDLTEVNLTGISYDCSEVFGKTRWPAGFIPPPTNCERQRNRVGPDLTGADFTGADLTGAFLTGANLTNIKYGCEATQPKTIWPADYEPPPSAPCH
jgi:uncharacterized protein YjbI with pentapeptide repeats